MKNLIKSFVIVTMGFMTTNNSFSFELSSIDLCKNVDPHDFDDFIISVSEGKEIDNISAPEEFFNCLKYLSEVNQIESDNLNEKNILDESDWNNIFTSKTFSPPQGGLTHQRLLNFYIYGDAGLHRTSGMTADQENLIEGNPVGTKGGAQDGVVTSFSWNTGVAFEVYKVRLRLEIGESKILSYSPINPSELVKNDVYKGAVILDYYVVGKQNEAVKLALSGKYSRYFKQENFNNFSSSFAAGINGTFNVPNTRTSIFVNAFKTFDKLKVFEMKVGFIYRLTK